MSATRYAVAENVNAADANAANYRNPPDDSRELRWEFATTVDEHRSPNDPLGYDDGDFVGISRLWLEGSDGSIWQLIGASEAEISAEDVSTDPVPCLWIAKRTADPIRPPDKTRSIVHNPAENPQLCPALGGYTPNRIELEVSGFDFSNGDEYNILSSAAILNRYNTYDHTNLNGTWILNQVDACAWSLDSPIDSVPWWTGSSTPGFNCIRNDPGGVTTDTDCYIRGFATTGIQSSGVVGWSLQFGIWGRGAIDFPISTLFYAGSTGMMADHIFAANDRDESPFTGQIQTIRPWRSLDPGAILWCEGDGGMMNTGIDIIIRGEQD